jgi:hypothetical protein
MSVTLHIWRHTDADIPTSAQLTALVHEHRASTTSYRVHCSSTTDYASNALRVCLKHRNLRGLRLLLSLLVTPLHKRVATELVEMAVCNRCPEAARLLLSHMGPQKAHKIDSPFLPKAMQRFGSLVQPLFEAGYRLNLYELRGMVSSCDVQSICEYLRLHFGRRQTYLTSRWCDIIVRGMLLTHFGPAADSMDGRIATVTQTLVSLKADVTRPPHRGEMNTLAVECVKSKVPQTLQTLLCAKADPMCREPRIYYNTAATACQFNAPRCTALLLQHALAEEHRKKYAKLRTILGQAPLWNRLPMQMQMHMATFLLPAVPLVLSQRFTEHDDSVVTLLGIVEQRTGDRSQIVQVLLDAKACPHHTTFRDSLHSFSMPALPAIVSAKESWPCQCRQVKDASACVIL